MSDHAAMPRVLLERIINVLRDHPSATTMRLEADLRAAIVPVKLAPEPPEAAP